MLALADGHSDETMLILFQSQTEYTKYQTGLTKENRLGIIMNAELTLNLNTENTT